jgi:NAD(P)-dependent dehydrogenase (short-subunit alcohol dehydrogenase family)
MTSTRLPADLRLDADSLRERVVLLTGAGDGIGRAVAEAAAAAGATVVLLGRTQRKLEAVYDQIVADHGRQPAIHVMDLATATVQDYAALAAALQAEYGRLDGIAHVAGTLGARTPLEHYDIALWSRVMLVNLTAPWLLTQACLPLLRQSSDPAVVFASSSVGRTGRAHWGAYAVSKFGIEGMVQVWAEELDGGSKPVRINALNPGPVRTAMRLEAYPAEDRSKLALPAAVAPAFVWALSPASHGVTGQSLDAQ